MNVTSSAWNGILDNNSSCLALDIVEIADAAAPPADIIAFKPGRAARGGELLLHFTFARRTHLTVDLAGSQGSAPIAQVAPP